MAETEAGQTTGTWRERILIVDDDESTRRSMPPILGKKGYETDAVATGREALQKAQERFYNLALLDLRLPDMAGVELLALLKAMHPDMAAIMVTGYASVQSAVQALDAGAAAYVVKPLNMDEVLPKIRDILDKQRLVMENKRAEAQISKLNRLYAVLSEINQAIVRIREPQALFDQVCRIAVEIGRFRMAWIGLLDESTQKVQVVAHAGETGSYFDQLDISLRGKPLSCCPVACAVRERQHAICHAIEGDAPLAPCQEIAHQLGFRSSAVFPLHVYGKIRGMVGFYSGEPDFFDEEEIKLLDDLAIDLSYAMEFAEKEAEGKRAEKEIRQLSQFLDSVIDNANVWLDVLDDKTNVVIWNKAAEEISGYSREEVVGHSKIWTWLYPDEEYRNTVLAKATALIESGAQERDSETIIRRKDGQPRAISWNSRGVVDEKGAPMGSIALGRDITEGKQAQAALQNAKEELERQNARLQALYHVGQAVNSTLESGAILDHLVDEAMRLTGATHGQVLVIREDLGLFERRSLRGFSPEEAELARTAPLPLDRGVNGQAYATRRTVGVDDVRTISGYFPLIAATRAEVAVPIVRAGRVLGNLDLQSPEIDAFHDVDLDYLGALADQVAIALEKARLFQAERQQRELAEALRQAAQAMGASLDLNETLRLILNQLKRVLVYDTASVLMFREGDVPDLVVGGGYADEQLTAREAGRLLRESPVLQRMARDLQPVVSADVRHLDGWIWVPGAEHVRSWLAIPLAAHGRLIGVLMADHSQPGFFGEAERQTAQALAQHAAQAIENARLYDEARRRNRELALLNRVIAASAASQDVASILETVCRELAQALGLPNASAALLNQAKTEAVVVAEYRPEDRPSLLGVTIPLPEDLRAVYLEDTTPLVVVDAQTDALLAPIRDLFRRRGTVSVLILPLLIEGEVAGSLLLGAAERHPFAAEEVDLARRVAEQVAGALAHTRLEETQRHLSTAVEQAAESIIITDTKGVMLYVNPAFERITGYSGTEAIGQNRRLLKSGKHDAMFYGNLWRTISAGQVWQGRFVNRKKDGSLYTEDAVITPVRNQGGEIVSYVATMRDVTHEVELEEQFRQAQKMEAIGRLAGGVAHDFNNLLTVIHLSARLLERRLHPEDSLWAHVQRIREAGERATGLTRQLLAFSRQEAIEPKVLSLNDVVSNISKMLQRLIGEDVELTTSLAEGLWPVYADSTQIEQVILNLAVNARDAMPQGGTVTIETANVTLDETYARQHLDVEPGEYVQLSISDTGSGMDDEVKKHLFEPFFTTKEKGKGTGLGLAMVFGIVKQNQGHVWVYSEVGLGTTFKIYLPRNEKTEAPLVVRAHVRLPSLPPGGTETVLLVEDEVGVRELAAQILSAQGYQVLTAANGSEALRLSGEHDGPIHLLLTDLVMPQMSGTELAEQLGSRRPGMRVLYMSGYTEDGIVQRRVIAGQVAFLSKPLTEESLIEKVRAALSGPPMEPRAFDER